MNENDTQTVHDRTRKYAYEIWLAEGCPEGRADQHWELARMKIATEDRRGSLRRSAESAEPEPITRPGSQGETSETIAEQCKREVSRTPARRANGGDQHGSHLQSAERETAWSRWREWMRGA